MSNFKKNIKNDHKELFALGKTIESFADDQLAILNARKIKLLQLASHKRIFLFVLTRAIKTYSAIEVLCHNGYAQDAASLVRSLLENLITVKYIISDLDAADEKTRRFVAFKWVIFKRYLPEEESQVRRYDEQQKDDFYRRKESILAKVDEFKTQYGISSDRGLLTWSGKTVKDMARIADKKLLREYESTFRMCSRFSHSSILGDKEYMVQDEGSLVFSPLPSEIGIVANYRNALKYFLSFLYVADQLFDLSVTKEIDRLYKRSKDVFNLQKYSPNRSAVETVSKKQSMPTSIKESTIVFEVKNKKK